MSDILFNLLCSLLEESEEHLNQYLPEFMSDVLDKKNSKNASASELTKGVDKFMFMISDVSDSPFMPKAFFNTIVKPLLEKNLLNTKGMEWCEKDPDEIFATEGHFKVFLYLLQWQEAQKGSAAKAQEWFKGETGLMDALARLKKSNELLDTKVDLDELCEDVENIDATHAFVTFLNINK